MTEKPWRWIMFGLLGIPFVLITYFYFVLHVVFHIPTRELVLPAGVFCAFVPLFSAGLCFGARARARGSSGLLFVVLGAFVFLCGLEFDFFEVKLGFASRYDYGSTLAWAASGTIAGYFLDKWIRSNHSGSIRWPR